MRKANFTHGWNSFGSKLTNLLWIGLFLFVTGAQLNAQCALACNGYTQVSLDENCEAEITATMILNADTTICPNGEFEVVVSYHGHVIPTSPVVTCDYINHTLTVMVRDTNSGNSCWGEIYVEDKLPPVIECGSDTIYCYQMPKYTGPVVTDNCRKVAFVSGQTPSGTFENAMDEVFGASNWDSYTYLTLDAVELLSCKYDVIMLDGGVIASHLAQLINFMNNHRSDVEDWVADGGSLLVTNAEGALTVGFNGFGFTQVISDSAFVAAPDHAIFNGPFCPSVDDYLVGRVVPGFPYIISANVVCPPGIQPLMVAEHGGTLLIEDKYGAGTIMLSSLVPNNLFNTFYMEPYEEAENLVFNILHHLRDVSPNKLEMTLLDERLFPMTCRNREFIKRVERDYIATDRSGNKSGICTQTLYLRRFPLDEVVCPQEWLAGGRRPNPIACEDIELGIIPTLPNGAPVPEYTGVPTIDGIPLWPPQDFYCDMAIHYDDIVLPKIGCVKKIMRTWTIQELCTTPDRVCTQLIEIVDNNPPVFTCPDDIVSTTKGGYVCEADIYLPAIHAEDICNNDLRIDVRYPGGFLTDQNGGLVQLPVGVHTVTYFVYDGCYNVDSCDMTVTVEDLTPPVAVCDRYTVVGLTYDDVAHVYAETFDDGTYDDCYIDSFAVKRMDDGANCGVLQNEFKSYVEFCCDDVDGPNIMVIFRAYDMAGNYNDCMVEVEVQDKILPHIYCPPNITVGCDYHYDPEDLSASFGKVVTDKTLRDPIVLNDPNADWDGDLIDGHAYDNCQVVVTTDSVFDINQCNVGTITRTFTATDRNGSVSCTQTITLENFHPFNGHIDITWPAEFDTIGCVEPDALTEDITGKPIFNEDQCDLVGYSFEDHVFPFFNNNGGGACLKIIRKWKVIDWCDFRFDSRTGRYDYEKYEYEQIIKVHDDVDPFFASITPDSTFCTFDTTCQTGPAYLVAEGGDACTPASELRWEYHIDLHDDGTYEHVLDGFGGTIDASADYELGHHRIKYVFEDRCGNKVAMERLFWIVNCKNPTPYCKNGLVVDLMPMDTNRDGTPDFGMIEIWASDFDLGSFGPCGNPVTVSFSADTTDKNRMYDCDSVGQRNVEMWVTDKITGNQSFCRTFIIIQDNNGACSGTFNGGTVSGLIQTEDKQGVKGVGVDLNGSGFSTAMSTSQGGFAFPMMPFGGTYDVSPAKNDDHLNGISTRDLVFIQRHLLGKEELNTPYKRIAADVDGNESLSVNDIVELRKLILGVYNELPDNTSWRFVEANYVFPDPKDPFSPHFPEAYKIDNFATNMPDVDFVGVKVGDVDGSVDASGLGKMQSREDSRLLFSATDRSFTSGELVSLDITSETFDQVTGYQFTLNFDPQMMAFIGIDAGLLNMDEANAGLSYLQDGIINISWHNANGRSASAEDVLFSVQFEAIQTGNMSDAISMNSRMVRAEAYNTSDEVMGVQLGFNGNTTEAIAFRLYQNHPNPFSENTVIGFDLPEDGDVQLTIYDVTGKVIALQKLAGKRGYNSTEIYSAELTSTGVLYYQLDSKGYTATRKMVVLQ